jgi:hypothetical protein
VAGKRAGPVSRRPGPAAADLDEEDELLYGSSEAQVTFAVGFFLSKVWWQDAILLYLFLIFYNGTVHTFIQSHSHTTFICRHSPGPLSPFPDRL